MATQAAGGWYVKLPAEQLLSVCLILKSSVETLWVQSDSVKRQESRGSMLLTFLQLWVWLLLFLLLALRINANSTYKLVRVIPCTSVMLSWCCWCLVLNDTFIMPPPFPVFARRLGRLQVLYSGCFQGRPSSHGQEIAPVGMKLASERFWGTIKWLKLWAFGELRFCAGASQSWPQSWTPRTELSSTAEPKPLPPQNWTQMSWVSVSSIYTLCIFTTDQMIRMLVCSGQSGGRNFQWYFYLRQNEFIRRNTPLHYCKNSFGDESLKTCIWGNWVTLMDTMDAGYCVKFPHIRV